jgi:hypothetical protein
VRCSGLWVCCESGSLKSSTPSGSTGRASAESPPQDESELQLLVLLRHSSRGDRVTALELLWQAALAERATESYFSIRISDRASPERRRAIDEFLAREVEPDGINLFARSGPAHGGARKTNSGEAAAEY